MFPGRGIQPGLGREELAFQVEQLALIQEHRVSATCFCVSGPCPKGHQLICFAIRPRKIFVFPPAPCYLWVPHCTRPKSFPILPQTHHFLRATVCPAQRGWIWRTSSSIQEGLGHLGTRNLLRNVKKQNNNTLFLGVRICRIANPGLDPSCFYPVGQPRAKLRTSRS